MAYDPVKAHEYYINFRKKGKKKGRKKGSSSESSTKKKSLVGLSNSGLNDQGKVEYAFLKEKLTSEMNAELEGVEDAGQIEKIRRKYQAKALKEVNALKDDDRYAKVTKAEKAAKAAEKQRKVEEKQRKAAEREKAKAEKATERERKSKEREAEKQRKAAEKEQKAREREAEKQRKAQQKAQSKAASAKNATGDEKTASKKTSSSSKTKSGSAQSTQAASAARKAAATRLKSEITRLQELIEKTFTGVGVDGQQISVSALTEPQKEKTQKIISQMLDSLVALAAK